MNGRLISATIAVVLFVGACTVKVEDLGDESTTAPDTPTDVVAEQPSSFAGELVAITIPGGWTASENDDGDGVTVAGPDVTLEVTAVPSVFFGAVFLELPAPVEPEALAELVAPALTGDGVDNGEAEIVELDGELRAVTIAASDANGEGEVILFDLGEGAIAIATAHSGPGSYAEVLAAVHETVASFALSASVDDLLAALGSPTEPAGN